MKTSKTKNKILKVISREGHLSKRKIAEKIKLSPATVSKYVDVMVAEGLLKIDKEGVKDIVRLSNDR